MYITVDGFHISLGAARSFAKRHRSAASHGLDELPAFCGQYFPEQVGRCKRDVRAAALTRERIEGSLLDGLPTGH